MKIPRTCKKVVLWGVLLVGIIAFSWGVSSYIPRGEDWYTVFRPATLALLAGKSPYTIPGFFNPPWALLPLIPFALLPENVGRTLLLIGGLTAFAYIGHRLGGSKWAVIAMLLSPPLLQGMLNSNIDWLALLGVVLPPPIGLFFVTIKPQVGLGIVVFWLAEAWRSGGWEETLRLFGPVTLAGALSLVVYGWWPFRATEITGAWWNASLWPMSLPIGLALLVAALRKRHLGYALSASPYFAPYLAFHTWVVAIFGLIRSTPATLAVVVGLWLLVVIRALTL